jgi:hypothetical protein
MPAENAGKLSAMNVSGLSAISYLQPEPHVQYIDKHICIYFGLSR